jgi:hypothetical protein
MISSQSIKHAELLPWKDGHPEGLEAKEFSIGMRSLGYSPASGILSECGAGISLSTQWSARSFPPGEAGSAGSMRSQSSSFMGSTSWRSGGWKRAKKEERNYALIILGKKEGSVALKALAKFVESPEVMKAIVT